MKQYTFDGTVVEYTEMQTHKGRIPIQEKFRIIYGYDENTRCKDCIHCIRVDTYNRHYYKCDLIGISSSEATDIRLKDLGCRNFKDKKEMLEDVKNKR